MRIDENNVMILQEVVCYLLWPGVNLNCESVITIDTDDNDAAETNDSVATMQATTTIIIYHNDRTGSNGHNDRRIMIVRMIHMVLTTILFVCTYIISTYLCMTTIV